MEDIFMRGSYHDRQGTAKLIRPESGNPLTPGTIKQRTGLTTKDVLNTPEWASLRFIMAYEEGELEYDEVVEGFQHLMDSGLVWQLQDSYGRQAMRFIESGEVVIASK